MKGFLDALIVMVFILMTVSLKGYIDDMNEEIAQIKLKVSELERFNKR